MGSQNFTMKIPWPPSINYKKIVFVFVFMVLYLSHSCHPIELNQIQAGAQIIESANKMLSSFDESLKSPEECPQMIPKYFANVQPRAGFEKEKITYWKKEAPETKEECVQ